MFFKSSRIIRINSAEPLNKKNIKALYEKQLSKTDRKHYLLVVMNQPGVFSGSDSNGHIVFDLYICLPLKKVFSYDRLIKKLKMPGDFISQILEVSEGKKFLILNISYRFERTSDNAAGRENKKINQEFTVVWRKDLRKVYEKLVKMKVLDLDEANRHLRKIGGNEIVKVQK